MIIREFDMREPVKAYLVERDFIPVVEFYLHYSFRSDIIGAMYHKRIGRAIPKLFEIVAVELKLDDFCGVLSQSVTNRKLADWSYVAMPSKRIAKMRASTLDKLRVNGVGLLSVSDQVTELIQPMRGFGAMHNHANKVRQLWNRVRSIRAVKAKAL